MYGSWVASPSVLGPDTGTATFACGWVMAMELVIVRSPQSDGGTDLATPSPPVQATVNGWGSAGPSPVAGSALDLVTLTSSGSSKSTGATSISPVGAL